MTDDILKGNTDIEASSIWTGHRPGPEPAPVMRKTVVDIPRWCLPPGPVLFAPDPPPYQPPTKLTFHGIEFAWDPGFTDELLAAVIQNGRIVAAASRR